MDQVKEETNIIKVKFVHVKKEYIDFLRTYDRKVQDNYDDNEHHKPYVSGIKINIRNREYLAPLTSYKEKYDEIEEKAIFKLIKTYKKKKEEKLAVVLLNNMIPLIDGVIEEINFNDYDKRYQSLLRKEYQCLSSNEAKSKIIKIANDIYKEVTERRTEHFVNICCDFLKLEAASEKFNQSQTESAISQEDKDSKKTN